MIENLINKNKIMKNKTITPTKYKGFVTWMREELENAKNNYKGIEFWDITVYKWHVYQLDFEWTEKLNKEFINNFEWFEFVTWYQWK